MISSVLITRKLLVYDGVMGNDGFLETRLGGILLTADIHG